MGDDDGREPPAEGTDADVEVLLDDLEGWTIERAVLNDSPEGKDIAAGFVSNEVRPILRKVSLEGGEPQLLVNGLAELLRSTADSIEFPLDHPRSGSPGE